MRFVVHKRIPFILLGFLLLLLLLYLFYLFSYVVKIIAPMLECTKELIFLPRIPWQIIQQKPVKYVRVKSCV